MQKECRTEKAATDTLDTRGAYCCPHANPHTSDTRGADGMIAYTLLDNRRLK